MAVSRDNPEPKRRKRPPATTPEARENQLIDLAVDLAEKQLEEGSASSQVLTHFLKLASTREKLDQEKIRNENALLQAKIDQLGSMQRIEELYGEAMNAMRSYQGEEPEFDDSY